jgi:hypothetical protein
VENPSIVQPGPDGHNTAHDPPWSEPSSMERHSVTNGPVAICQSLGSEGDYHEIDSIGQIMKRLKALASGYKKPSNTPKDVLSHIIQGVDETAGKFCNRVTMAVTSVVHEGVSSFEAQHDGVIALKNASNGILKERIRKKLESEQEYGGVGREKNIPDWDIFFRVANDIATTEEADEKRGEKTTRKD